MQDFQEVGLVQSVNVRQVGHFLNIVSDRVGYCIDTVGQFFLYINF